MKRYSKVVVITGPGIYTLLSNDLGNLEIKDVLRNDFAKNNSEIFHVLIEKMKDNTTMEPTFVHKILAEYNNIPILTENVDMLHQIAGSDKVIELRGNIKDGIILYNKPVKVTYRAYWILSQATHLVFLGCNKKDKYVKNISFIARQNGTKVIYYNDSYDYWLLRWINNHHYGVVTQNIDMGY